MKTICVTGSRMVSSHDMVYAALDKHRQGASQLMVGNARGADALAAQWGCDRGMAIELFVADWNANGKSAGYRRNATMVDSLRPDTVCVAFAPDSFPVVGWPSGRSAIEGLREHNARGTADCVSRMLSKGLSVVVVNVSGEFCILPPEGIVP
jgi:hypothetical protein